MQQTMFFTDFIDWNQRNSLNHSHIASTTEEEILKKMPTLKILNSW